MATVVRGTAEEAPVAKTVVPVPPMDTALATAVRLRITSMNGLCAQVRMDGVAEQGLWVAPARFHRGKDPVSMVFPTPLVMPAAGLELPPGPRRPSLPGPPEGLNLGPGMGAALRRPPPPRVCGGAVVAALAVSAPRPLAPRRCLLTAPAELEQAGGAAVVAASAVSVAASVAAGAALPAAEVLPMSR